MKVNPLSPGYRPEKVPRGKEHKLESRVEDEVRRYFSDLGDEFDDIHKGVFFTPHPVVAYAYAWDRQTIGMNDFGSDDVEDPPVLVGVKLKQPEYMDTDAMVTAKNILDLAQKEIRRAEDPDDIDDFELVEDYARSSGFSLEDVPLSQLGGDIGNRPEGGDLVRAVHQMVERLEEEDIPPEEEPVDFPEDIRQYALDLAKEIIPQSRVLQDVNEEEIMAVLVMRPIMGEETKELGPEVQDPMNTFSEWEDLNDMSISDFDDWLTHPDQSLAVIQRAPLNEIPLWHGTALSYVREAYPGLIPLDRTEEILDAASTYDQEAMRAEYEEDDE